MWKSEMPILERPARPRSPDGVQDRVHHCHGNLRWFRARGSGALDDAADIPGRLEDSRVHPSDTLRLESHSFAWG
jgi:hypothetical protein